jgi:putative aldouronate transport system permease protein
VGKRSSTRKDIVKYRSLYIFIIPAIVTSLIFYYRPMIGVIMAFQEYGVKLGYFASPFVGFKHLREFLSDPEFFNALKNTLGINLYMILFGFPLPIILALILNEIGGNIFKRVSQTITYLPHFISWVVVGGLVYRMLDMYSGNLNNLLEVFGMKRVPFMRKPEYFWAILVATSIWKELGWTSIIYLAGLSSIDSNLYEAAGIDGAGRFQKLVHITIPGLMPTISVMLIFTCGTIFTSQGVVAKGGASFDSVYNLANPLVMKTANVLDYYVYTEGIRWGRMSYAAAIGFAKSLVSLGLVLAANLLNKKIKGYAAF